jgi:vacuolar-type H+-ATPase subunit H
MANEAPPASQEEAHASILVLAARHEKRLVAELAEVKNEAQRVQGAARERAAELEQAAAVALAEEIARLRQNAEAQRNAERDAILGQAGSVQQKVRSRARERIDTVAVRILKMVLPGDWNGGVS